VTGFSWLLFDGISFPKTMRCSLTNLLVHAVITSTALAMTAGIYPPCHLETAFTVPTLLNVLFGDNPALARLAHL
jgi:hypothetical protein